MDYVSLVSDTTIFRIEMQNQKSWEAILDVIIFWWHRGLPLSFYDFYRKSSIMSISKDSIYPTLLQHINEKNRKVVGFPVLFITLFYSYLNTYPLVSGLRSDRCRSFLFLGCDLSGIAYCGNALIRRDRKSTRLNSSH